MMLDSLYRLYHRRSSSLDKAMAERYYWLDTSDREQPVIVRKLVAHSHYPDCHCCDSQQQTKGGRKPNMYFTEDDRKVIYFFCSLDCLAEFKKQLP